MKTVKEVLRSKGREVHVISPERTVYQALQRMAAHDIGALVVLEGGRITGVVTERDYARKIVLQGSTSRQTPVRDVVSETCITVVEDDTVEHCMALMTRHRVRHLPVLHGLDLVGLVSIGDLVKARIAEQGELIDQLQHYIQGAY